MAFVLVALFVACEQNITLVLINTTDSIIDTGFYTNGRAFDDEFSYFTSLSIGETDDSNYYSVRNLASESSSTEYWDVPLRTYFVVVARDVSSRDLIFKQQYTVDQIKRLDGRIEIRDMRKK